MVREPDEFAGSDVEWIAADAAGHVAVFTIAGGGPMPKVYRSWPVLEQVRDTIRALPVRTTGMLCIAIPRPDDYIMFAERGFFSYDWTDFHRSADAAIDRYELMARPAVPVLLPQLALPAELRAIVPSFHHANFAMERQQLVVDG